MIQNIQDSSNLSCDRNLNDKENSHIFKSVLGFIKNSKCNNSLTSILLKPSAVFCCFHYNIVIFLFQKSFNLLFSASTDHCRLWLEVFQFISICISFTINLIN